MIEVIIGIVSGIVSAMGMGGGTILILCLTVFLGFPQHVAQASNLVFFIPTSFVAIILNWKQKLIDKKLAILIIPPGIVGAVIGARFANNTADSNLRKYFGIFLLFITIYELYSYAKKYIFKKNKP